MARQNEKKRGLSLGILFWIACILLVLVVFLFSRSNIQRVLEETKLIEVVNTELRGEGAANDDTGEESTPPSPDAENQTEPILQNQNEEVSGSSGRVNQDTGDDSMPADTVSNPEPIQPSETQNLQEEEQGADSTTATEQSSQTQESPPSKVRTFQLFFVKPREDGTIAVEARQRGIRFIDSPLTATIQALIAGPVTEDRNAGYTSLIPEQSQLISAWVREGTAFLNFNDSFRFNPYGLEGNKAQLQQIIFTATEFPTVDQVQILIEGDYVEYISGDGIYVGAPLRRGSF